MVYLHPTTIYHSRPSILEWIICNMVHMLMAILRGLFFAKYCIVLKDHVSNNLQQTSYLHPNRILQIMAPLSGILGYPHCLWIEPNSYQDFQPQNCEIFLSNLGCVQSCGTSSSPPFCVANLEKKHGGMPGWQRLGAMAATISCPKPVSSNWWFRPNPIWKIYVSSNWIVSPGMKRKILETTT